MNKWKEKRLVNIKALMEELSIMTPGKKISFSDIFKRYKLATHIKYVLIDCKVIEEVDKGKYNYIRTSSITDTILNKIDEQYITVKREYYEHLKQNKVAKVDPTRPNKQLSILDKDINTTDTKVKNVQAQKFGQIMGRFKQLENFIRDSRQVSDYSTNEELLKINNKLNSIENSLKENKKNNISLFWGLIKFSA